MGVAGKFGLEDLQDLKIGEAKDSSSGCLPLISGSQPGSARAWAEGTGFGYPDNGEFDFNYSGNNNCRMKSFQYGYEEESGIVGTRGTRASVKRTSYKGERDKCCESGNKTVDGKTCDPKYSDPLIDECSAPLQNFCKNPSNMGSSRCQAYVGKVGTKGNLLESIKTYCTTGDNITSTFCQQKDLKETWTDEAVKAYCSRNPGNTDFCGCFNISPSYLALMKEVERTGTTLIPWCNYTACASNPNAYKPTTADNGNCPAVNVCLQSVQIGSVGGESAFKNVNFTCDQKSTAVSSGSIIPEGVSNLFIGIVTGIIAFFVLLVILLVK
jgi:hypothetical protein